jgi:hypothetical protein
MSDDRNNNNKSVPLTEVVDEIIFRPRADQRKMKSALWVILADNPLLSAETITPEDVVKFTNERRVRKWWSEPGFREWLMNQDEFRQRLEYHAHLALDRLEAILMDDDSNPSAQVQAAKLIIEAANKMPPRVTKEVYADERIQTMDRKQLEEYIRRNMTVIPLADQAGKK